MERISHFGGRTLTRVCCNMAAAHAHPLAIHTHSNTAFLLIPGCTVRQ